MSAPDVDLSQGDSPDTEACCGDRAVEPEAPTSVVTECELPDAPEKVWRALTVPKLLAGWLPEATHSEILEAQPNRLLRYRWSGGEHDRDDAGRPLESVVTFELDGTESGGTHLRVIHELLAEEERVCRHITDTVALFGHAPSLVHPPAVRSIPAGQGGSKVVPLVRRRKPLAMAGIQTTLRRAA
jgi:uncharacterized protein YndB with AHSA1/START domain